MRGSRIAAVGGCLLVFCGLAAPMTEAAEPRGPVPFPIPEVEPRSPGPVPIPEARLIGPGPVPMPLVEPPGTPLVPRPQLERR